MSGGREEAAGRVSEGDAELGGRWSGNVEVSGFEKYRDRVSGSLCDLGEKKADVRVLCTSFFLLSEDMVGLLFLGRLWRAQGLRLNV